MKTILLIFAILLVTSSNSQVIPVKTFINIIGEKISVIDDTLSTKFRAQIDEIDKDAGIISWKLGFNGDHSNFNQYITYTKSDSSIEITYEFPSELHDISHGYANYKTFYSFYESELNDSAFVRIPDSFENWRHQAIAKNFKLGHYIIKLGKLASSNTSIVKIIDELRPGSTSH